MIRIIKYVWIVSMLFFLVALLMTHSFSSPSVNILDVITLPKEQFFYIFLSAMVLVNSFILLLGNLSLDVPKWLLFVPQRSFWISNINTQKIFKAQFKLWLKGLALFFNLFFIAFVSAIAKTNVEAAPKFAYQFFILLLGFGLIAWLVYYFRWFTNIKDTQEDLGLI